jgi:tellurite resistance protein TerC
VIWIWSSFIAFIILLLALDLGVFHRQAHVVKVKEALAWSAGWITLGLSFTAVVYFLYEGHWHGLGLTTDLMSVSGANPLGHNNGRAAALKFITGYLIEKSLSVDNIFVIAMVFGLIKVPALYRHRVLFWGILGALVMRGAMIAVGAQMITRFSWTIYLFGGILILTALKMMFIKEDEGDPAGSAVLRWARRTLPVTHETHGEKFFVKQGTWMMTPLFLALLVVEFTDLVFAVDSIPAIFAITTDPFLVFTSNVFAILGLRSLYFALEGMIDSFHHLKTALALVLLLVGIKMMAHTWLKAVLGGNFNLWILLVVLSILAGGVIASIVFPKIKER